MFIGLSFLSLALILGVSFAVSALTMQLAIALGPFVGLIIPGIVMLIIPPIIGYLFGGTMSSQAFAA